MRNRLPFACPTCRTELGSRTVCPRCGVEARDALGEPPLGPRTETRPVEGWWPWWVVAIATVVTLIVLQARREAALSALGVAGLVAGAVVLGAAMTAAVRRRALRAWLRERSQARIATRRRTQGGVLRAIVDATGAEVRVRGRVRAIRPVPTPEGDLVAAFRSRRVDRTAGPTVVEVAACGRFVIDDGSGVAVIDDDAFSIEALDVRPRGDTLAIRDGDLVEVVGPARREPAPDVTMSADEEVLVFDGRRDAPVLLVPLPIAASLAPPRSRAFGVATRPGPQTLEHDALHEVEAGGRAEAEARGPITR